VKIPIASLERMHVLNFAGTISKPEWEIARFYQVLQFSKKSSSSSSSSLSSSSSSSSLSSSAKPPKNETKVRLAALKKLKAEFGSRLQQMSGEEKEARLKFYFEELMEEE
jgi:hypothetical protein